MKSRTIFGIFFVILVVFSGCLEDMTETEIKQEVEKHLEGLDPKTRQLVIETALEIEEEMEAQQAAELCSPIQDFECHQRVCGPDDDFDCCIRADKCWLNGSCQPCEKGCQFASDCPAVCDGDFLQKMGCNLETAMCEKTFRDDCSKRTEIVEGIEVSMTCIDWKKDCGINIDSLKKERNKLRDEYNEYNNAIAQVGSVANHYRQRCITVLGEFTNKLIIESADLLVGGITSSARKLFTEAGKALLNEALNIATMDDSEEIMSAEEYVAWVCKADQVLTQEERLLEKKRDLTFEKIEKIDMRIAQERSN